MSQGIPGWDFNQQDYLDAWGRRQSNGTSAERFINSFLNPANTSKDRSTEVDAELMRLYESGMTQVLPQKAARSLTIDKEPMTSEQYRTYSEKRGQTSLELVTEFMDSREYKSLDDAQRAEIIKSLYDFAASTAADKIRRERGESAATKLRHRKIVNLRCANRTVRDLRRGHGLVREFGRNHRQRCQLLRRDAEPGQLPRGDGVGIYLSRGNAEILQRRRAHA